VAEQKACADAVFAELHGAAAELTKTFQERGIRDFAIVLDLENGNIRQA
jgi:hypothetical protein